MTRSAAYRLPLLHSGEMKMKLNNFKSTIGGSLLAVSLVLGIGIMSSTTAQAQRRNDGQWQRRERNRQERIYRNERRRDDRDWRNDGYGNNGSYGRNDGYGNNGRYGNNGGYNNNNNAYRVAMDQGYQAGLNTGASDAQRRQSYSPQRSHYYKDASTQAFREGFVQGYDAGYRQYGGYNNGDYRTRNSGGGIGGILGGIFGRP